MNKLSCTPRTAAEHDEASPAIYRETINRAPRSVCPRVRSRGRGRPWEIALHLKVDDSAKRGATQTIAVLTAAGTRGPDLAFNVAVGAQRALRSRACGQTRGGAVESLHCQSPHAQTRAVDQNISKCTLSWGETTQVFKFVAFDQRPKNRFRTRIATWTLCRLRLQRA